MGLMRIAMELKLGRKERSNQVSPLQPPQGAHCRRRRAPLLTISATGARAAKLTKSAARYQGSYKEGKEDRLAWSRRRALYRRNDYFEGERP